MVPRTASANRPDFHMHAALPHPIVPLTEYELGLGLGFHNYKNTASVTCDAVMYLPRIPSFCESGVGKGR
jgi:hypothetical protein